MDTADALITPDSMRVRIRKNAEIDPITNAIITANNVTKYHTIYNATVNIKKKREYNAYGDYDYVDETDKKFKIHFATTAFDSINLDARRRRRHHNHRPATHLGRRERNTLRMIARRSADHATLELFGGKTGDLVISATQLEGKDRLQVFALQQNLVADPCRKVAGQIERRFDGHIVNLCVENFFEIIRVHGAIL